MRLTIGSKSNKVHKREVEAFEKRKISIKGVVYKMWDKTPFQTTKSTKDNNTSVHFCF